VLQCVNEKNESLQSSRAERRSAARWIYSSFLNIKDMSLEEEMELMVVEHVYFGLLYCTNSEDANTEV